MKTLEQAMYEMKLAENTKCARRRALLLLNDGDRFEEALFGQARKLDTGDGIEGWIGRYTQALAIYNQIITFHGHAPQEVPALPA